MWKYLVIKVEIVIIAMMLEQQMLYKVEQKPMDNVIKIQAVIQYTE